jgi:hypothetical protein
MTIYDERADFMENVFCVILSKYRIYQGVALYRSLEYNYKKFNMFILCVDDETYQLCQELNLTKATLLQDKDLDDERLIIAKKERRLNEYCWTLKPFFLEYVLDKYDSIENAVYLDADICFFNDPSAIFTANKSYCIQLSEHDFQEKNAAVEQTCGKYNSGFIVFKNCETSVDALRWWQDKCIEWCQDGVDEGRFGDQKYLELLPLLYDDVYPIITPGVNIAPWNESKYQYCNRNGKVYINDDKLVCYHFCGLRILNKNSYALVIGSQKPISFIHTPYAIVLQEVMSDIESISPDFDGCFIEEHFNNKGRTYKLGR